MLYFIAGGGSTKIGASKDAFRRLEVLQTGNPALLRLTYQCEGDCYLERQVWETLHPRLIRGEWFEGEIEAEEAELVVESARPSSWAIRARGA